MPDTDTHSTETALDQFEDWDVEIPNVYELKELQVGAKAFVESWLEPLL